MRERGEGWPNPQTRTKQHGRELPHPIPRDSIGILFMRILWVRAGYKSKGAYRRGQAGRGRGRAGFATPRSGRGGSAPEYRTLVHRLVPFTQTHAHMLLATTAARCTRAHLRRGLATSAAPNAAPRTVLITGAEGGVGRALSAGLARQGFTVVGVTFKPEAPIPGVSHQRSADLRDPGQVRAMHMHIHISVSIVSMCMVHARTWSGHGRRTGQEPTGFLWVGLPTNFAVFGSWTSWDSLKLGSWEVVAPSHFRDCR